MRGNARTAYKSLSLWIGTRMVLQWMLYIWRFSPMTLLLLLGANQKVWVWSLLEKCTSSRELSLDSLFVQLIHMSFQLPEWFNACFPSVFFVLLVSHRWLQAYIYWKCTFDLAYCLVKACDFGTVDDLLALTSLLNALVYSVYQLGFWYAWHLDPFKAAYEDNVYVLRFILIKVYSS